MKSLTAISYRPCRRLSLSVSRKTRPDSGDGSDLHLVWVSGTVSTQDLSVAEFLGLKLAGPDRGRRRASSDKIDVEKSNESTRSVSPVGSSGPTSR